MLSRDVELSVAAAFREAEIRRHEFVTLEHLLYALLHNDDCATIIAACGGEAHELRTRLEAFFRDHLQAVPGQTPYELEMTRTVRRMLQRIVLQARGAERDQVGAGDVLAGLLLEADSHAAFFLQEQGISRVDVLEAISHGGSEMAAADGGAGAAQSRAAPRGASAAQLLQRYTTDLTARAADGAIDPLIGRENEIDRALQILGRRHKNSPDAGRRRRRRQDRHRGRDRVAHRRGRGPAGRSATPASSASISAPCSPAPSSAATSRSASRG